LTEFSILTAPAPEIFRVLNSAIKPEEALAALREMGIEWYLTEGGDLMIKYWQVGAKGFIAAEHTAAIRMQQDRPPELSNLEWLSQHLNDLQQKYAGQWIAVEGDTVVATAPDIGGLLNQTKHLNIEKPFVTKIPLGDIVWQTAFTSGY
jgi:hypothetical protein